MQTCIWPSRCHCHSLSLASVKSRLVSPFWYQLTWLVPDKRPLKGVCNKSRVPIEMSGLFRTFDPKNQDHFSTILGCSASSKSNNNGDSKTRHSNAITMIRHDFTTNL